VAKFNRPTDTPQSLRDLQRQIKDEAERWREHPSVRKIKERVDRWREHPLMRRDQERLRQLAEARRQAPPSQAPTLKRKHGGGPKPKLTADEVARLQAAYWANPPRRGKRKQSDAFTALRKLLPKDKRDVGDSTLRSHIVRPRRT
jgi:hypothetical protein